MHTRWILPVLFLVAGRAVAVGQAARTIELRGDKPATLEFAVEAGAAYGLLVSAPRPSQFSARDAVAVRLALPQGSTVEKRLHAGDPDLYVTVRAGAAGKAALSLTASGLLAGRAIELTAEFPKLPGAEQLGAAGHSTWQTAQPMQLGQTVYASGDDRPYIPEFGPAKNVFQQMLAGVHWYRFDYAGPGERLAHINLEILDRDVPVDVALFTIQNGRPVEYTRGRERYEQERSTNLHGLNKFLPRVLAPGRYYLRVMANHPDYQLQTELYPLPPYDDPRQAIRTAMDYVIRRGDSWHSDIPRQGMVALRSATPLQETRLCIACHPTQFSTRGHLVAMENGYPVRARQSLQYLVERLYNNPRPIYGRPEASWARMIHAPGNVLSRVAWLTDKFERELATGERRDELFRGVAAYLEMYWPGQHEPQPESNGNLPRISGFEIALHNGLLFGDLYARTGLDKYAALRAQTERVVEAGEPADVLDLCWKIDALVTFGKEKYSARIRELAETLLAHQKPDGTWAMPFGMEVVEYDWNRRQVLRRKLAALPGQEGPRSSDFQTYHALYALARAGYTPEDPRVRKAVTLCLARQTPSGAWQGPPDYKNFDTPFRDTQYALMALSTLFPGSKGRGGARGWGAGFPPPPAVFPATDVSRTLAALDEHWEPPAGPTVLRIRQQLDSPAVLVRYQAAVALGRFADSESVPALVGRLGDPSKLVQRAAAWSLRQIASRRPQARTTTLAGLRWAMRAPGERTRWGAVRVFNQHFKYLTDAWGLAEDLLRLAASEPVPAVKMSALQALYQWWYWDGDAGHRESIEKSLIAGLGRDEHPWVRRNFIEAYYNVLDDNVRYLYGSWIPRLKREQDREAIRRGHQEHVRLQAARYREAMLTGDSRTRDGLLRALSTHHVREGLGDITPLAKEPVPETLAGPWLNGYRWSALYDPLTGGRGALVGIGNDSEPPVFYEDSAPLMNDALCAALGDADPALIVGTLRVLTFLRGFAVNDALADRVLALLSEGAVPGAVRAELVRVAKAVLPGAPLRATRLESMVRNGDGVSIEVAAALLADARQSQVAGSAGLAEAVEARLRASNPEDAAFPHVIALVGSIPSLRQNPGVLAPVMAALRGTSAAPRQAALRLVLEHPQVLALPAVASIYHGYPEQAGPAVLSEALRVIASLNYSGPRYQAALPEIRRILLLSLDHPEPGVRSRAAETVRLVTPVQDDAAVLAALRKLATDADRPVRNSARAFLSSLEARAGGSPREVLDYEYFRVYVEPVLTRKGHDGLACAHCHANHSIFKLSEPDQYGVLTLQQSRANFEAASRIVNVREPESSLLLNKPISPLDDEGIGDSREFSHGGGLRWPKKKDSAEYKAVLRWIRGGRLDSRVDNAGGGEE